ncbi:MAG: tetratricopeptide repeat protein [Faecalimonas sp.]|nr:tetratricopeptide repeat protein [Faecalimonas sp.]
MRRIRVIGVLVCVLLLLGCATNLEDGTAYLEAKDYEQAAVCFQKDIAEEKHLAEAYRGLGIAQYELGEYEAALEAFEMARASGAEETATFYSLMAACQMQMEAYEAAMESYAKVLEQGDCTEELRQEARYNEIAICQELSDWELAKEKVASYVEDYPEDSRMNKTAEFLETR